MPLYLFCCEGMNREAKQTGDKKRCYQRISYGWNDMERMESWLMDMAAEGFLLNGWDIEDEIITISSISFSYCKQNNLYKIECLFE